MQADFESYTEVNTDSKRSKLTVYMCRIMYTVESMYYTNQEN